MHPSGHTHVESLAQCRPKVRTQNQCLIDTITIVFKGVLPIEIIDPVRIQPGCMNLNLSYPSFVSVPKWGWRGAYMNAQQETSPPALMRSVVRNFHLYLR